jgi:hypothetical protein
MTHGHPDKDELKNKYKANYEKVQGFVNEFDPCGFIHFGAPVNEYDCLTSHLLSAVYTNKSRQELKEIILDEIENHFGTPDLTIMIEPEKTQFYMDIDLLLDKLNNITPNH